MEEYLLQHNVTMTDFWIFVVLWCIGTAILTLLWTKTIKVFKEEKKEDRLNATLMLIVVSTAITYVILPPLAMGAVHFVRMIIILNPHMHTIHWMFILGVVSVCIGLSFMMFAFIVEWKKLNKRNGV